MRLAKRNLAQLLAASVVAALVSGAGCAQIFGVDQLLPLASGSDSGSNSSSGGSSGGSGSGSSSGVDSGGSSGVDSGGSSGGRDSGLDAPQEVGPTAVPFATGEGRPVGIALSTATLVWTDSLGDRLRGCDVGMFGNVEPLSNTSASPSQVVASPPYVYWVEQGEIAYCLAQISGCTKHTMATANAEYLVAGDDAGAIYYSQGSNVYSCPSGGTNCASPMLAATIDADAGAIHGLALSAGWILIATEQGVIGCAAATCPSVGPIMALSGGARMVATDATYAYAVIGTTGQVVRCNAPPGGCTGTDTFTALYQSPGGTTVTAMVSDGTLLYWAQSDGRIASCPPGAPTQCASPTWLATGLKSGSPALAYDNNYLYFTDPDAGSVYLVPK